jgi:hypothetical protein
LDEISEENLQSIVGKRFEYNEDIRLGRMSVKTFEKREICAIDIKTVFSLNSATLQSKELANQQRRWEETAARKRREEELRVMAENGNVDNIIHAHPKKKKAPVIVLTEEEKKKQAEERKAERMRRFNDFKQILNNVIIDSSASS